MFEFLPDTKRGILVNHNSLGKPFFSGAMTKHQLIQNIRAFATELCSRELAEPRRFSGKEILSIVKEIERYPSETYIGDLMIFQDNVHREIEKAKLFFHKHNILC